MPARDDRLLEIYLADHHAAASAGVALARRSASNNAGTPTGDALERLWGEIAEDRQTLGRVIAQLGFEPSRAKTALARAAERLARLKPNGRLRGYSPLSRVIELEALSIGIAGKLALWESLLQLPHTGARLAGIDLESLAARARRQRDDVEELRVAATREAFG